MNERVQAVLGEIQRGVALIQERPGSAGDIEQCISSFLQISVNLLNEDSAKLLRSAMQTSVKVLDLLLKYATLDVNATTESGVTVLHIAVKSSLPDVVERLLQCDKTNVNARDASNCSPLHHAFAINSSSPAIAEMLLRHPDIDVNAQHTSGVTSQSILECAVLFGSIEAIELLLTHPNLRLLKKNDAGQTELHQAFFRRSMPVLTRMLQYYDIDLLGRLHESEPSNTGFSCFLSRYLRLQRAECVQSIFYLCIVASDSISHSMLVRIALEMFPRRLHGSSRQEKIRDFQRIARHLRSRPHLNGNDNIFY